MNEKYKAETMNQADILKLAEAEPFAWATFDGEGSYELRLYENNESYQIDYYDQNGAKYEGWVKPLYSSDTVRELQLKAIRAALYAAYLSDGESIDPTEILKGVTS